MTGDRQLEGRWRYEKSQCSGHEESSEGEKWKLKSQLWKESELERNTSLRESLFWFSFFYQKERFLIWKKGAGWRERERGGGWIEGTGSWFQFQIPLLFPSEMDSWLPVLILLVSSAQGWTLLLVSLVLSCPSLKYDNDAHWMSRATAA